MKSCVLVNSYFYCIIIIVLLHKHHSTAWKNLPSLEISTALCFYVHRISTSDTFIYSIIPGRHLEVEDVLDLRKHVFVHFMGQASNGQQHILDFHV